MATGLAIETIAIRPVFTGNNSMRMRQMAGAGGGAMGGGAPGGG
jgi:hypothetical protein